MSAATRNPTPATWTLRFKNDKTTILLFVDPLQALHQLRTELLRAITASHPDGKMNGFAIPANPDDIMLGRLVDDAQSELGFVDINDASAVVSELNGKGKGKAGAGTKSNGTLDCAKGVGFRADGVVAFKFRSEHEFLMNNSGSIGNSGIENELDELDDSPPSAEIWNVHMPSIEETYGPEDEGNQ